MPRTILCKIDNCTSKARQRGRCKTHYRIWRKANPEPSQHREPEHRKRIRSSPYWYLWVARKDKGELCDEWLSTDAFAQAIHPRPKDHALCRIDPKKPYGPGNFVWRPKVKRCKDESMTDYALRLRVEQLSRFPDFERDRMLIRNYRLTPEDYEAMSAAQNHVCATCLNPERDMFRGKLKKLAVDHCHKSKKIRGLLCLSCNTSLGKLKENVDTLKRMIAYIEKHREPELQVVSLA